MRCNLRMCVSLLLVVLWLITGVTGVMLFLAPSAGSGRAVHASRAAMLHTYFGLASLALSMVHIALNWRALKAYLRRLTS
jgi:hypothetical protein